MEGRKQVAVIGGDARQAAAGRALARAGYTVCGAEQIALADYILLPLPLDETRTPLAELLRAAKPGALALGGRLSAQAKQIAQEAGVELVDYFAREELTIRNAIPTAEGCLGILLRQRKRTLWGSGVLVTGFGPVGQALGAVLNAEIRFAADSNAGRGPCISRFLTLVLERDRYRVHQFGLPVARVHREFCHPQVPHFCAGDACQMQRFFKGLRLPGGKGEPDVSYQNHTMIAFFFIAAPCIQYGRSGLRFSCSRSCTG